MKSAGMDRIVRRVQSATCMVLLFACVTSVTNAQDCENRESSAFAPLAWRRPVDNPVFTSDFGNNHDAVLFVEPELEYPYHLIISHTAKAAQLWRAKKFSWNSADWELVEKKYKIGKHYEYDDGVKVGDTYYLFEAGIVYTFTGDLAESSGKWKKAGTFPKKQCDDIGVFCEEGVFHIFGEFGKFPHGADGTSLAHFTSLTGLGDWKLVNKIQRVVTNMVSETQRSLKLMECITSIAMRKPRAVPIRLLRGVPAILINLSNGSVRR